MSPFSWAKVYTLHAGGSAANWWTRSPNTGNSTNFYYVNSSGSNNNNNASNSYGVVLGLCDDRREPLRRGYVKQSTPPGLRAGEIRTFTEGDLEPCPGLRD